MKGTGHRINQLNWVGGLKNYVEGMMSNGKKVDILEGREEERKNGHVKTHTHARTNIGMR